MKPLFSFLSALVLLSVPAFAAEGTGLNTSVAVDIVATGGDPAPGMNSGRIEVREAELMFYAPVDHLFDGQLGLAAHQEDGSAFFEIHEAYLGSSRLIPRSRFKVGQFFLGVGRLNQFHRHDWPFTSAPREHREFFGDEAAIDTGLEYSVLTPLPFYLDLTGGVTNGWSYGHAHGIGQLPKVPTHYLRALTYVSLPGEGGMQTGLNYLGRKDAAGANSTLLGVDVTAKWREAQYLKWLFQSEVWHRSQTPAGAESIRELGLYVYPQYGFGQNLSLGLRVDYFTNLTLKDALDRDVSNADFALVPTLTYKASEFSTLRASATSEWLSQAGTETEWYKSIELQLVFLLGAHPSHDF